MKLNPNFLSRLTRSASRSRPWHSSPGRGLLVFGLMGSLLTHAADPVPRNLLAGPPEAHELYKDIPGIEAALLAPGQWHPFPRATDRTDWANLEPGTRARLIAAGEASLDGPWTTLPPSVMLDYVRNGNRESYQTLLAARRQRLTDLVLAECVEGQARFLDTIADGIWATCEETYWGYPAHLFMQRAGSGLPDVTEPTVDLGVGETGAMLAWIHYLLAPQLDTVSPLLTKRIRHEVDVRLLTPCLERADFWWMGWDQQGHPVNNWNPWIVSNWLSAALLLESDAPRQARQVEKAQRILDVFINHYPADGGCDEGPSYWSRAAGSLYEALEWMHGASAGRISIFEEPLIRAMGRYILDAHIGGAWFVNFADATATAQPDGSLIYRYGRAIADDELAAFGTWIWQQAPDQIPRGSNSLGRLLPTLFLRKTLLAQPAAAPLVRDTWLPDLQLMMTRDTSGTTAGFFVAAKGGHNDESHNHNDVGSFMAYLDGEPLLIDVGPEVYTAKTFSAQRYEIWTMRSDWHNLPVINGTDQAPGRAFAARAVQHTADDSAATLSLDLAATYPAAAAVHSWQRDITLERGTALRIVDDYVLDAARPPAAFHFITNRPVDLSTPGVVRLGAFPGSTAGRHATLHYDASALEAHVTPRELTDARLLSIWGKVYRIELIERAPSLAARRVFELRPARPSDQR